MKLLRQFRRSDTIQVLYCELVFAFEARIDVSLGLLEGVVECTTVIHRVLSVFSRLKITKGQLLGMPIEPAKRSPNDREMPIRGKLWSDHRLRYG